MSCFLRTTACSATSLTTLPLYTSSTTALDAWCCSSMPTVVRHVATAVASSVVIDVLYLLTIVASGSAPYSTSSVSIEPKRRHIG